MSKSKKKKKKTSSDEKKTKKNASKKKHTDKEKEETKRIEEGLEAIYGEEAVDFSKVERSKSRLTKILLTIVIGLAIIALTAWAGFFVYTNFIAEDDAETFELSIDAPDELVSGNPAVMRINYANTADVPLASFDLEAKLPPAFSPTSITPAPTSDEALVWNFGSLNAHTDGTIVIEGVWVADAPSTTSLQAVANYRPTNFNADFSEIATTRITTLESVLIATIEGPEETRPGDDVSYTINVENTGTETMNNVDVDVTLPDGFFLDTSDPAIEPGAAPIWTFEQIAPESTETISFSGSFAADTQGFQYFDVNTGIRSDDQLLRQATTQGFTDVVGSQLSLQLVANGSTERTALKAGEELRISLSYENVGEVDIEEMELLLDFQANKPLPITWDAAQLDEGRTTREGILWDAELIGVLVQDEKRIHNLTFPLFDTVASADADQFQVVAQATIGQYTVRSKPIEVVIDSEAQLSAEVRYFTDEGAPLGTGPLPPSVGETTVYRMFWHIENRLHDLENVTVSALLPPRVNWNNTFDADLGSVTFDEATRTVTWRVEHVPTDVTELESTFAISITPEEDDVGTFVKLISGSTLEATDAVTGSTLTKTTESLTTELPEDEFAAGKGVVVE